MLGVCAQTPISTHTEIHPQIAHFQFAQADIQAKNCKRAIFCQRSFIQNVYILFELLI